jgi:hypothetical protein
MDFGEIETTTADHLHLLKKLTIIQPTDMTPGPPIVRPYSKRLERRQCQPTYYLFGVADLRRNTSNDTLQGPTSALYW